MSRKTKNNFGAQHKRPGASARRERRERAYRRLVERAGDADFARKHEGEFLKLERVLGKGVAG